MSKRVIVNDHGERQIFAFCPRCRHHQPFQEHKINHGAYLGLSLLTLGLGLISWLAAIIGHRFHPWRCVQCGWQKARSAQSLQFPEVPEQMQASGAGVQTAMDLKLRAERYRQESSQNE